MEYDYQKDAIKSNKLEKVVDDFSATIDQTLEDLMSIYERYYAKGSTNQDFLEHCLTKLLRSHQYVIFFMSRVDLAEGSKKEILEKVLVRIIYNMGIKTLIQKGHAVPQN